MQFHTYWLHLFTNIHCTTSLARGKTLKRRRGKECTFSTEKKKRICLHKAKPILDKTKSFTLATVEIYTLGLVVSRFIHSDSCFFFCFILGPLENSTFFFIIRFLTLNWKFRNHWRWLEDERSARNKEKKGGKNIWMIAYSRKHRICPHGSENWVMWIWCICHQRIYDKRATTSTKSQCGALNISLGLLCTMHSMCWL